MDWTGDSNSIFKSLGSSNHCDYERQSDDYYATEPKAVELLLQMEKFDKHILEPACGEGHISNVLKEHGYDVDSRDLIDRGYGKVSDFLSLKTNTFNGDIITNPPYKYAQQFVEKALSIIPDGNKVAMFLKLTFLEGKGRRSLFSKYPPLCVYVSSSRLRCAMNGDFSTDNGSAVAYAWFVWKKGFNGEPVIRWFN